MSEWKEMFLNEICQIKGGKRLPAGSEFADGVTAFPYLRVTDMVNGTIDSTSLVYVRTEIEPFIRNYKISKSDLYVTIAGTLGLFGSIPERLDNAQLTENAAKLCDIDLNIANKDFLKYYLNSQYVQSQINREIGIGGGVPKLALYRIAKLNIKLPALTEQRQIALILSTCDAVIEKTQAAIAKYKAIKQGMLNDLFTRGIDLKTGKLRPKYEDAPVLYKESKLGWIPKEWEVELLGNEAYFYLKTGGTPSTLIKEYWNGNIRWMSSGEVNKKRIYEVDGRITELGMENSNAIYYPIHSVVIGLAGQGKTRGTVAITYVETTSNQSIAAVVFNKNEVNPFFYYHLLDYEYERLRSVSAGAGRAGLSLNILSQYHVLMPTKTEQNIITEKLETIDNKLQSEQAYLQKLQAIKQGLMSDLLSGKVRTTDFTR